MLQGQDIFKKGPHLERIQDAMGPDERSKLETYCKNNPDATSLQIWEKMEEFQEYRALQSSDYKTKRDARVLLKEVLLQYSYPRLDINVSKQINHLLKSPFVVHPKTGRVCVPIDPSKVDDFNPLQVPTIGRLVEELNRSVDVRSTSLREYTQFFETEFLKPLENKCLKEMGLNSNMEF